MFFVKIRTVFVTLKVTKPVNDQILVCLACHNRRRYHVTGPPLAWVRPPEVSVQESGAGNVNDYVSEVK
jgi:Tfp pilus assembly protein PilZ